MAVSVMDSQKYNKSDQAGGNESVWDSGWAAVWGRPCRSRWSVWPVRLPFAIFGQSCICAFRSFLSLNFALLRRRAFSVHHPAYVSARSSSSRCPRITMSTSRGTRTTSTSGRSSPSSPRTTRPVPSPKSRASAPCFPSTANSISKQAGRPSLLPLRKRALRANSISPRAPCRSSPP